MSTEYLRLADKPGLSHPGYPICEACRRETDLEDGMWICPSCGTGWDAHDMEASSDEAMRPEEYGGEPLTGNICPNDVAHVFAQIQDPQEREQALTKYLSTCET